IRRVSIRVLEMSDDPDADRICEILGVASYWDVPLADAVVTLRRVESETPAQGTDESESATTPAKPVPGPTRTNSKGQYRLEGVYPGKYILRVKGLLRNKPRIEEKEIDVIPNRRRQIQVDFDIR
ncbi:MAG: carboxypeptidase-like regulatory domain-containing protein, partial [Planctomycetota bacterium]